MEEKKGVTEGKSDHGIEVDASAHQYSRWVILLTYHYGMQKR